MPTRKIAVLGANGHTARFIMARLHERCAQVIPATRSGHCESPHDHGTCARLDFNRPDTLDHALAHADAVINCAGPFLDTAGPSVEAALRAGIPYLDLSAEQMTTLRLFQTYDQQAQAAGITVVPAMAFYGGLADLLVSALARDAVVDQVELAVGLDHWRPTPGTRLTGQKNTFQRMIIRGGALVPVPTPSPAGRWTFPEPLGEQPVTCVALSEIVLIHRHLQVGAMTSYMNLQPLDDLHDANTPPPENANTGYPSSQRFVLDARVTVAGTVHRATATGRDIYAASAPLIVNACLALLDTQQPMHGVRCAGELFEPRAFLQAMSPAIDVRFW